MKTIHIESMADIGMGVIYESTSSLGALREQPSPKDREQLLQSYYQPHYRALEQAVEGELERNDYAQIIDCHRFPSIPLPYERDQDSDRPDFCLGLDEFHTNPELADLLANFLRSRGFSVKLNSPFSGSIVSSRQYQSDDRVQSLMIEINRPLYIDEGIGEKTTRFRKIQELIIEVLNWIREFERLGEDTGALIRENGELVASQDWDSGSPGVGAGRIEVYHFLDRFHVLMT